LGLFGRTRILLSACISMNSGNHFVLCVIWRALSPPTLMKKKDRGIGSLEEEFVRACFIKAV